MFRCITEKVETLICWWRLRKCQGITRVIRNHPPGDKLELFFFFFIYQMLVEIFRTGPKCLTGWQTSLDRSLKHTTWHLSNVRIAGAANLTFINTFRTKTESKQWLKAPLFILYTTFVSFQVNNRCNILNAYKQRLYMCSISPIFMIIASLYEGT